MILTIFLILPLIAAVACFFMKQAGAKFFAGLVALCQLLLGLKMTCGVPTPGVLNSFVPWVPALGLNWSLGLDGANLLLVVLTPLLTVLAILSLSPKTDNLGSFVASILLLDGFLCGLFLSQNLGLFYIFFEAMLLPVLILISGWAKRDGPSTAYKFLMYTLVGSLPMLLGVLSLAFSSEPGGSLEFSQLGDLDPKRQYYLFFPFLLAFLVKMPIVPFHGWLPTLYRNAPASVTVLIAALMSKAGTYGLLKVGLTVFPIALGEMSGFLAILAVVSLLYGAFSALGSNSLREVLAYSSLSHIAMIAFGITSLSSAGVSGACLQMAGHALATGGLFLVVAMMENRGLPDEMSEYGGLAKKNPRLAAFSLFLVLAALGQPGLGSFPGELLILTGTWGVNSILTVLATLGIVLAGAYMLYWYQTIFTGPKAAFEIPEDLTALETAILTVPILLSLAMGFAPSYFLMSAQSWLRGVL